MHKLLNFVLEFIFPRTCIRCGEVGSYICNKCIKNHIKFNFSQKCHVCGKDVSLGMTHKECSEESFLDGVIFACYYDDLAKKLVRNVKYNGFYKILDEISKIILIQLREYNFNNKFVLTYVPMHRSRKWERGFNQTEILAKNLSTNLKNSIYVKDLILRTRKTKKQVGLDKSERSINLKEAFSLNPKFINHNPKLQNLKIYIVDDVYTTGATLNECAKVLKENGFKEVYGICFAKSRV